MTAGGRQSVPWPRAVLFDWDNTLVENWRSIQAALNEALAAFGKAPLELEQVKHQARHSARDIFPSLFGQHWRDARDIYYAHLRGHHLAGLRVMPGTESAMDALSDRKVPLGIVSNKNGELLRREIDFLGWDGRFASVVGAQDAPADKPDPAPVRLALDRMEINAGESVWLVGDTDIDMRAAIAAGCVPILVGAAMKIPDLFADAKPVLICADCNELAGFVRSLWDTICQGS